MVNDFIRCQNLVLGFSKSVLSQPINLSLKKHRWYGIIGKNGIGKSTFLKTLLSVTPALSGHITIDGQPSQRLRRSMAYIPQEREINVSERTTARTLIKASYHGGRLGLPSFNHHLNQRIDELVDLIGARDYINRPFEQLSGGQKKRIYLIGAMINKPEILLLDEPLADLDQQAKHDFVAALRALHRHHQLTLMMISHDMQEIAYELDEFIHFKDGQAHLCHSLPCLKEEPNVIL
ncbi:MAG: metal ABC transporter ATP-binding protein [Francisellaceae bacterium]